jgi:regulatory protein
MAVNRARETGRRQPARAAARVVGKDPDEPDQRPLGRRSLLAQALGCLARREYSRAELAGRLRADAESEEQLRGLLDQLEAKGLLSDRRFAESLARSRGERFGAARVGQELRQRGVDAALLGEVVGELRRTELERAREVWKRRFGAAASSREDRLRQLRFLSGRGFDAEVIRRVVDGKDV